MVNELIDDRSKMALEFAVHCLRWKSAHLSSYPAVIEKQKDSTEYFDFEDAKEVIEAASKYINRKYVSRNKAKSGHSKKLGISITYGAKKRKWHVSIAAGGKAGSPRIKNTIAHYTKEDLCHAIMGACVKANYHIHRVM